MPRAGEQPFDKPPGVREGTVQASHQRRGSTVKKRKLQPRKWLVGGKDSPGCLVAGVRDGPGSHLSCPNAAGALCCRSQGKECIPQLPKRGKGDTQFLTAESGRSPVMRVQGASLGKAATEAREGTEEVTKKHFTLLRRVFEG